MTDALFTAGEAILDGGIRSVRFFNGRLLTGEDLSREQDAHRLARLRLGRACGDGVVHGLGVTRVPGSSAAVVRVAGGLAVNRNGRVLELPTTIDLALSRGGPATSTDGLLFSDCMPPEAGGHAPNAGVYLLVIGPAQAGEGRAPVSGLGNAVAACNVAYSIESVRFRLLRLSLPSAYGSRPERLRNRVAHLMLGTDDPARLAAQVDPLGTAGAEYGLLDDLRRRGWLDAQEVPLATLRWTREAGIAFIDRWAARRRLVSPSADDRLSALTSARRRAEGEAAFLAFHEDVAERTNADMQGWTAADTCAYLPAVGIVPIARGSTPGVNPDAFLGDRGSRDLATLDPVHVRELVQASFDHDPIEVDGGERIQRYVVWEKDKHRTLVFAHRTLPYRGVARYRHARYGRTPIGPSVH